MKANKVEDKQKVPTFVVGADWSTYVQAVDKFDYNASNVCKAFSESLPGFVVEQGNYEDDNDDEQTTESEDGDLDDVELDEIQIPQRIACFANTLQLSINDGLKSCSPFLQL